MSFFYSSKFKLKKRDLEKHFFKGLISDKLFELIFGIMLKIYKFFKKISLALN